MIKERITYKTVLIKHEDINSQRTSCKSITINYIPHHLRYENKIDKFEISERIPKNLKEIIKYFFVFKIYSDYVNCIPYNNLLFVTIDDKVFGLGKNSLGVLGLGHNSEVENPKIITELCDKRVKYFFYGCNFVFCLTSDNQLYGWGKNEYGQLGIGVENHFKIYRPILIEYFQDKTIKQICCGLYHSSVLTSDGKVYLWGGYNTKTFNYPIECELVEEIKLIHCSEHKTYCVTISGRVCVFVINDNTLIKTIYIDGISNIEFICSSCYYTYFISRESVICISNRFTKQKLSPIMKEIRLDFRTISISMFFDETCIFYNDKCVYELKEDKCFETKYSNPFDYYCDRYKVTFHTIELNINEQDVISASNTTNTFMTNFISQENNFQNILKPFSITERITILRSFIKYFYVFDDYDGYNMLFVTNDNNVYGYGTNNEGLCGFGHNNPIPDPQLIPELCHENVIKFFSGFTFAMALTSDNELYVWGIINDTIDSYSRPMKLLEFECKIENLCCGWKHALILTEKGVVYGWGDNLHSQINEGDIYFLYTPIKLDRLPKIKLIACSNTRSLAVSEDNQFYIGNTYWNLWNEKFDNVIDDIVNICADDQESFYVLTNNRKHLYYEYGRELKRKEFDHEIKSIHYINSCKNEELEVEYKKGFLIVFEDGVYYMNDKIEIFYTNYKTPYDYISEEYQLTYKTIDLKLQNEIQTKDLKIKGINII